MSIAYVRHTADGQGGVDWQLPMTSASGPKFGTLTITHPRPCCLRESSTQLLWCSICQSPLVRWGVCPRWRPFQLVRPAIWTRITHRLGKERYYAFPLIIAVPSSLACSKVKSSCTLGAEILLRTVTRRLRAFLSTCDHGMKAGY